jgi:hypothetical protein
MFDSEYLTGKVDVGFRHLKGFGNVIVNPVAARGLDQRIISSQD